MIHSKFQVLAEIYKLLGQFESGALAAASRTTGISKHLRAALTSLAAEAGSAQQKFSKRRSGLGGHQATSEASQLEPPTAGHIRGALSSYFSDELTFPSKAALVEFARRQGIQVAPDPKWGRARLASKLVELTLANPSVLDRLTSEGILRFDSQTSGWVDVIRRSRV